MKKNHLEIEPARQFYLLPLNHLSEGFSPQFKEVDSTDGSSGMT
jgi:hypothetical protein